MDVGIGWIGHVSSDQMKTCIPHHFLYSTLKISHKIHAIHYGQTNSFSPFSFFSLNVRIDWGTFLDHLNEHNNLHVDKEQDMHMNSKNYEENDYNLDLDSLIILY